jgi:hypothetical protein
VIEPERAPRAPATVLVTVEPGYALALSDADLDGARFDRAVSESHRLLTASAAGAGAEGLTWVPAGVAAADLRAAMASLDEALACGAARRTSSSRRRPPPWPSVPGSRSSERSRWRTAPSPRWRWVSTPWSRRARVAHARYRCASGSGGCGVGVGAGGSAGRRARGAGGGSRCARRGARARAGAELRSLQTAVLRQEPRWRGPRRRVQRSSR